MSLDYGTPSERFYEEFEEGIVPVRYAIGWTECESAPEWLDRVHEALDVLESLTIPLDELFELSHQYTELGASEPTALDGREWYENAHLAERRPLVEAMMAGGLTFRQIARWLEVPESDVCRSVLQQWPTGKGVEDALIADEMLWSGRYTNAEIARASGIHRNTIARLRAIRFGPYEQSTDNALRAAA